MVGTRCAVCGQQLVVTLESWICNNSACSMFKQPLESRKPPSRNPAYVSLIHKMLETHEIKSHDYADDNNPFSNFEFAAQVSAGFKDEVDKTFATLIGVKLARLQQLLNGKSPKNESIDDTFLDLANYSAIWASYRMKR